MSPRKYLTTRHRLWLDPHKGLAIDSSSWKFVASPYMLMASEISGLGHGEIYSGLTIGEISCIGQWQGLCVHHGGIF